MKHYKELNALRNKISDGRSTRDSIARATKIITSLQGRGSVPALDCGRVHGIGGYYGR
jgi:hypothetical protein|nr:MAG TPA: hypothetical protein [Caudoviricetes sp.]